MAPVVHLATSAEQAPVPLPVLTRLSLAELVLLTDRAGHPRLPLDLDAHPDDASTDHLQERLSGGSPSVGQRARGLVAAAHEQASTDPTPLVARMTGIGLLDPAGTPVGDVLAALGTLASPESMLVLDLAVRRDGGEARLRSFFAVTGTRVVQLSTVSGLSFELAWFDVGGLAEALTRAATIDDDDDEEDPIEPGDGPPVPLELPFEVFTDGTEAVRRGREDLLAEVLRMAPAPVRVAGEEVSAAAAADALTSFETTTRGRLRVLVTVPQEGPEDGSARQTVGVISWLRTTAGWWELSPRTVDGVRTVRITPVEAHDLPRAVAPVLAQVVR
jgi:hypothetical protein